MKKVFISYRREDTQAMAGRLYDALEARLGTDRVFFDIDSIPLGTDFRKHVRAALDHCGVLLVLIGARWLEGGRDGRRRLDDPDDLVRVEVEAALERRIPVVPVLIDQTVMPSPDLLPDRLAELAYRNAVRLDSGIDFRNHLARLVAGITPLVEAAGKGTAPSPAPAGSPAAAAVGEDAHPTAKLPAPPRLADPVTRLWRTLKPERAPTIPTTEAPVDTPRPAAVPAWRRPWMLAVLSAAVFSMVYVSLSFRLARSMDEVEERLQALALPPPGTPAPAPGTSARPPPSPDLRVLLREEIQAGRLSVTTEPDRSVVLLHGDGLFAPGSASIEPALTPLLKRIAGALNQRPGMVTVSGHTDDVPMRTSRFPSNFHLSGARARAVGAAIVGAGVPADRVRAEGRADSEPLAPNDTPAGRARNRRIEITLQDPQSGRSPDGQRAGS